MPLIFNHMVVQSNAHCLPALNFLLKHPFIIRHIKNLTLRPNRRLWSLKSESKRLDEDKILRLLESITPQLVNLHTFVWEGSTFPKRDSLWSTLRKWSVAFLSWSISQRLSCPYLKNIGTVVRETKGNETDLPSHSKVSIDILVIQVYFLSHPQLFDFRGLHSFSMTVIESDDLMVRFTRVVNSQTSLPTAFWDFLRNNEQLSELSLCTSHFVSPSCILDVSPLFEGSYSHLKRFSVGNFRSLFLSPSPWLDFLEKHDRLESIGFEPVVADILQFPQPINLTRLQCQPDLLFSVPYPLLIQDLDLSSSSDYMPQFFYLHAYAVAYHVVRLNVSMKEGDSAVPYQQLSWISTHLIHLRHLEVSSHHAKSFSLVGVYLLVEFVSNGYSRMFFILLQCQKSYTH